MIVRFGAPIGVADALPSAFSNAEPFRFVSVTSSGMTNASSRMTRSQSNRL